MTRPLRILAWNWGGETEIGRYRFHMPLDAIVRMGLAEVRTSPTRAVPESPLSPEVREQVLEDARWADVLWTERCIAASQLMTLKLVTESTGVPWVLDIDDNILEVDPDNIVAANTYLPRPPEQIGDSRPVKRAEDIAEGEVCYRHARTGALLAVKPKQWDMWRMTHAQVCAADAIITYGREIELRYRSIRREWHPYDKIYDVPYPVDPARWAAVPPPRSHEPEVWMGSLGADNHGKDSRLLVEVADHFLAKYPHVRFFWKLQMDPSMDALRRKYGDRFVWFRDWVPSARWEEWYTQTNLDIVLAPLLSTRFNDCRSPMKWLEAGMAGKPCVASRMPVYEDVIRNGTDGFLAARPGQWIAAIERLVGDKELRARVGAAARERVTAGWSVDAVARKLVRSLADASERLHDRCRQKAHLVAEEAA